jgi:hypothetical protein
MAHPIDDELLGVKAFDAGVPDESPREKQRMRYDERKAAESAEATYQSRMNKFSNRKVRQEVPVDVKNWIFKTQGKEGYQKYTNWLDEGNKQQNTERAVIHEELPKGIGADVEHATSLGGDPKKQVTEASPLTYRETQRGSDDPKSKFTGSRYYNIHQNKTDSFSADQMAELDKPDSWRKSAAYFFAFGDDADTRLNHSDWLALQQGEITAEELAGGKRVQDQDPVKRIEDIHKGEVRKSIRDKWSPESKSHKRLSKEKKLLAELGYVEPDKMTTTELDPVKQKGFEPDVNLKQSAKNLFTSISNPRNLARIAGSSNNPLVNMGGDIVGAVMDGVSFVGDPSAETAIDLALSSSQVATNLAAMGLAALPIPGARPGAFALMKLGDHISKAERLWNLGGRDMSKANKNQADAIRKDLDLDAARKRMKIKQ